MADITIYGVPRSNYVRAVKMTAAEKGASFEVAHTTFREFMSPEHKALHPFGKMPVMQHGDVILYETVAIMKYLDGTFGEANSLQPDDFADSIDHEQWLSAINDYIDTDFIRRYALAYAFPKGPDGKPDPKAIEKAVPLMRRDCAVLESALADSDHLVGGKLTLADILLAATISYMPDLPEGNEIIADFPNVSRVIKNVAERESFKAAEPPQ